MDDAIQDTIGEDALGQGFRDPVAGAQTLFRDALRAMSRPGLPVKLTDRPAAPEALPPTFAAIALALCDYETPIWLDPQLAILADVRRYLAFNTGAPLAAVPGGAAFAFCKDAGALPAFEDFALGTLEYPDRSTTIVALVDSFNGGGRLRMTGPGIKQQVEIAPQPLPPDFKGRMKLNRELFPRGIDLILATADTIVGLPRSVQILE